MAMGDRDPQAIWSDAIGWHMPAMAPHQSEVPAADVKRILRQISDGLLPHGLQLMHDHEGNFSVAKRET